MPIARFQMPDGRIARFEVPDGTPPEAAQAAFEQHLATQSQPDAPTAAPTPQPQRSLGQNLDRIARRTVRMPLQAAASTAGMVGDALNTGINAVAGTNLGMPSAAMQRGINSITPQPETTGERVTDFVGSVAAGGLGRGVDPLARAVTARFAAAPGAATAKKLTPKQQTLLEAQEAGYVTTPSQGDGGAIGNTLEALVGKDSLKFAAINRNQTVTDDLARRAVGLPKDADLTFDTIGQLMKETYNSGYEPLKQLGRMTNGGVFRKALDKALTEFQGASSSFPGTTHDDVAKLVNSYRVRQFDAADGVQAIQNLREGASTAFRSNNKALGKASNAIARALEDSIEMNLNSRGMAGTELLEGFKQARTLLSKQHVVRNALREGTGNVDAHKIAAQLQRGKPLTNELGVIGRFANTAKKVTTLPDAASRPAFPYVPTFAAGAVGGPVAAALVGASPIAKGFAQKGMLTGPVQRALGPQVDPNIISRYARQPGVINAMPTSVMQSGLFGNNN